MQDRLLRDTFALLLKLMVRVFKGFLVVVFFVLMAVAMVVFFMPSMLISRDIARKQFSEPTSRFLNWRGAEVHFVVEGHGPAVVMIHGYGGSCKNFDKLAVALKDSFRVIRVDVPGFGLSDMPPMGEHPDYLNMYSDYIRFVLDTLHIKSACLMGNSMGGGIAWLTAAKYPKRVKKLVLLASAGYDAANVAAKLTMVKYKSFGRLLEKGVPEFVSRNRAYYMYADPTKMEPEVWELNNQILNREGNIASMLELARAQQFPDTNLIKDIKCPTLIIWGKQDCVIPVEHADRFHRDITNSSVIVYDTCGHVPMMECPERLRSDFVSFIRAKS